MTTRALAYGIGDDGRATALLGAGLLIDVNLVVFQPPTGGRGAAASIDALRERIRVHEEEQGAANEDPSDREPFRVRVVLRSDRMRDVVDGGVLHVEDRRSWTGGVLLDRATRVPLAGVEGVGLTGPKLFSLMKRTARLPTTITPAERRRVAPATAMTPKGFTIDIGVNVDVGGVQIDLSARVEASSKGICTAMGCPRPICDRWCR